MAKTGFPQIPRQFLRSALGVSLVLVSVAVVAVVTNDRSGTRLVFVSSEPLIAGQPLDSLQLSEVRVSDAPVFDFYLDASTFLPGSYPTRSFGSGELIPLHALSTLKPDDHTVVTIELQVGSPAWLVVGAVAELWVSPGSDTNSYSPPFVVSPEVVVVQVTRDDGFAADQTSSRVDILVPRRNLPAVLHAVANRDVVHLTALGRDGR
jgi:hypothetical protein